MMKFFTPELYLRYNSSDDNVADIADEEWETALLAYRKSLLENSKTMSHRVKDLAESLSLHDAELLSIQEDVSSPQRSAPRIFPFSVATISVKDGENITNLIYILNAPIEQGQPVADWPFSKLRTHWLYDEIDVRGKSPQVTLYVHRILWSDGRVTTIPFLDVIVQSFSPEHPETAVIAKIRA